MEREMHYDEVGDDDEKSVENSPMLGSAKRSESLTPNK
jgi:hypothetical protein